jgi:hypothetical protein
MDSRVAITTMAGATEYIDIIDTVDGDDSALGDCDIDTGLLDSYEIEW